MSDAADRPYKRPRLFTNPDRGQPQNPRAGFSSASPTPSPSATSAKPYTTRTSTTNLKSKREANLYDAIAHRVTTSHLRTAATTPSSLHEKTKPFKSRQHSKRPELPLPPADVLFRRSKAPPRYEEPHLDPYGAHRWLASRTTTLHDGDGSQKIREAYPTAETLRLLRQQNEDYALSHGERGKGVARATRLGGGGDGLGGVGAAPGLSQSQAEMNGVRQNDARPKLPDSDLLKALHAYVSAFYARTSHDGGASDSQSLDETALLALGILVEEASYKVVSQGGWRALVEGEHEEHEVRRGRHTSRSVVTKAARHKKSSAQTNKARAKNGNARSRSASKPASVSGSISTSIFGNSRHGSDHAGASGSMENEADIRPSEVDDSDSSGSSDKSIDDEYDSADY